MTIIAQYYTFVNNCFFSFLMKEVLIENTPEFISIFFDKTVKLCYNLLY